MKKIKRLLLTIVLMISSTLIGCTETKPEKYIIATDTSYAPFEYQDGEEWVGIDIDIIKAISENQNFEMDLKHGEFQGLLAALESNQLDALMAGVIITDERKLKYDFSDGYFKTGVTLAISASNNEIKSLNDLKGKKIAIKNGTQSAKVGKDLSEKYGFITKGFDETPTMYEEVKTGNSVACFEDIPVIKHAILKGVNLKMVGDVNESDSEYGFCVLKNKNEKLLKMFNEGLRNIKQNGKYDEIIKKYLDNETN